MACHSHGVEQLPSWPWTQACASHPHTRCTGTWTFNLANAVLPLKYARGDCWAIWPWFRGSEGPSQQGEEDDRSHSDRMCEIEDRCWMASSRVLITYLIFQIGQCEQAVLMRSTKRVYEMSELKLSMKIQVWQSIEFCMNSMKLFFFFEMIDSCLIELRKRNPLRRTTFKLFRTFKWAVPIIVTASTEEVFCKNSHKSTLKPVHFLSSSAWTVCIAMYHYPIPNTSLQWQVEITSGCNLIFELSCADDKPFWLHIVSVLS